MLKSGADGIPLIIDIFRQMKITHAVKSIKSLLRVYSCLWDFGSLEAAIRVPSEAQTTALRIPVKARLRLDE